jgi:hypothetical protein
VHSSKALVRRLLACLLLVCSGSSYAEVVLQWDTLIEPFGHVYPALDLTSRSTPRLAKADSAASVLGNAAGSVGIRVRMSAAQTLPVRAELIVSGGAILPSHIDVDLHHLNTDYIIYPQLRWDTASLVAARGMQKTTLEFSLGVNAQTPEIKRGKALLHELNDALIFIEGGEPGRTDDLDFNWLFAAYVDEHSSAVDALLESAQRTALVPRAENIPDEPERIFRQVFSMWYALRQRGLRYVGVSQNASAHPQLLSQRVRFPEQSWQALDVNCVDGSVLLASAMLREGIEPVLAIIPGHMFLGFYLDAARAELVFLDISVLNMMQTPRASAAHRARIGDLPTRALKSEFNRFAAALDLGQALFQRHQAQFDVPDNLDFQLISISDARGMGVLPLQLSAPSAVSLDDGSAQSP